MSGDMTTAQLLAWADKCLGLAADRTDASETRERVGEARAIVRQVEEYEG